MHGKLILSINIFFRQNLFLDTIFHASSLIGYDLSRTTVKWVFRLNVGLDARNPDFVACEKNKGADQTARMQLFALWIFNI